MEEENNLNGEFEIVLVTPSKVVNAVGYILGHGLHILNFIIYKLYFVYHKVQ